MYIYLNNEKVEQKVVSGMILKEIYGGPITNFMSSPYRLQLFIYLCHDIYRKSC